MKVGAVSALLCCAMGLLALVCGHKTTALFEVCTAGVCLLLMEIEWRTKT